MRRLAPIEVFIVLFAAVMLYLGWRVYGPGEMGRFGPVVKAQKAPSELYARLLVHYTKPPVYEEEYRMQDVEGVSSFQYRIRGYNGKQITVTAPPAHMYDVSFFFGGLDQDGIWQMTDKPPRPGAVAQYTVYVKQLADYKQGQRTVTFTDPAYWATAHGREFSLDLSKQSPSDVLRLQSTQMGDPRYEKIVDDFRTFGPDEFRHNVAAARQRIGSGRT